MAALILDGRRLARERAPRLRDRAREVRAARGAAPRLLLLAFEGPGGEAAWISGKLRACEDAGVDARALVLPRDAGTRDARTALEGAVAAARPDGVFVQFPFPPGIDGEILSEAIPPEADIDAMSPRSFRAYMAGGESGPAGGASWPPLTVAATLDLLEAYGVRLSGMRGLVVGDATRFNEMFREALARRGVQTSIMPPGSAELTARLSGSTLVITSVARPGAIRTGDLAPGSVAVDGGYFNPGGAGDIDLSDGTGHLRALAPVPGGVGPMTVSALVEAIVALASGAPERGGQLPGREASPVEPGA